MSTGIAGSIGPPQTVDRSSRSVPRGTLAVSYLRFDASFDAGQLCLEKTFELAANLFSLFAAHLESASRDRGHVGINRFELRRTVGTC